jgi:outer membrane protein assembly factor BamB
MNQSSRLRLTEYLLDRRTVRTTILCFALLPGCLLAPSLARSQVFQRSVDLPEAEVERIDATAATHLENAERFLAEKQWDEAIESIRRVMENDSGQFIPLEKQGEYVSWIPVREFCQRKLTTLAETAPDALVRYRALVDPLAEQWYRDGVSQRREDLLRRIIDQAFASRWGDDALLLAGEYRLAAGDHAQARADWQRLSPLLTVPPALSKLRNVPVGSPLWLAVRGLNWDEAGGDVVRALSEKMPAVGNCFPDSDLDLANVRARLVLVSVLEGSLDRARVELELLERLHPGAEGQLGGRRGTYTALLADWLKQAETWKADQANDGWPTFAGNLERNGRASGDIDISGSPIWTYALPKLTSEHEIVGASRLRVADDMKGLLSYFPVVTDGTVYLKSESQQKSLVTALDLKTGKQKWEVDYPRRLWELQPSNEPTDAAISDAHRGLDRHAGVARFTLSVDDGKLFARMGSPVTGSSMRSMDRLLSKDQGWLVGLDLPSEGKPLEGFPIRPESSAWAFEGPPIYDQGQLYVAMRRADGPRAQIYVACFELPTGPTAIDDSEDDSRPVGRLRWRAKIAAAATIGGGDIEEIGNTLLTLSHGRLYCNTNLGATAAISAESGKVDWVVTYPRATLRSGKPDLPEYHFFRDLTPAMVAKDFAVVAPSDASSVFAVELASGRVVWKLPGERGEDIVHLLGSQGDVLNASGNHLYWIDLQSGHVLTQYPQPTTSGPEFAPASPRGFGRGVLTGTKVYWPTRENIYVFDQQPAKTATGWRPSPTRDLQLTSRGATGGNLTIAEGVLLIAAGDRLYAFDQEGPSESAATPSIEIR